MHHVAHTRTAGSCQGGASHMAAGAGLQAAQPHPQVLAAQPPEAVGSKQLQTCIPQTGLGEFRVVVDPGTSGAAGQLRGGGALWALDEWRAQLSATRRSSPRLSCTCARAGLLGHGRALCQHHGVPSQWGLRLSHETTGWSLRGRLSCTCARPC